MEPRMKGKGNGKKAIIGIALAAIMIASIMVAMVPMGSAESRGDSYNHILVQTELQKVLIGQNLQFEGFTAPVVYRLVGGDIVYTHRADTDNRIYNVNWPTSGAYYVNYNSATKKADAQLSVEEVYMPLELKVGTKRVSSIAAGTSLTIDTDGINLFYKDVVDLKVIDPDGRQIKYDEKNKQQFTSIAVEDLITKYGNNNLKTKGWTVGTYTFQIRTKEANACGLDVASVQKNVDIYYPEPSPPSAPQNLQSTSGDRYVNLSWSAPIDDGGSTLTKYMIYRGTSSGGEGPLAFVTAPTTSYNDTAVTNNQTYYYQVSAVNSAGEGAMSNETSATPKRGVTAPSAPQNLNATAGDRYVKSSWSAPSDDGGAAITNYLIYRGTTSEGETLLTTVGNVTTYNDTTVDSGQTFFYKVRAKNVAGEGPLSDEASATTPTPLPEVSPSPSPEVSPSPSPEVSPSPSPEASPSPSPIVTTPSAPRKLRATAGDGYVNLSWSAPSDDGGSAITEYKIYRGTSPGGESPHAFVSANTTSYNDTAVTNNQTYYYQVSAVNSAGEGAKPEEASAIPISVAPPTPPHPWWKSWLVPILIVIAVVVIAIAAILIYKKRGKRGEEREEKREEVKEEKKRFCMHCGASIPVGAKFCPNCGEEPIKGGGEVKVCKNCDSAIPTEAKFCSVCGAAQPID